MARRVNAIAITERRTRAIQLRRSGMSWDAIAADLGYKSRGAACQDVNRALQRQVAEQANQLAEYRVLEDGHLDDLRRRMMNVLMSGSADQQMKATDRLVRVAERKAKLNGLDASDERDERMVRLAESQGLMVAEAIRRIVQGLGLDPGALEVREVVRRELETLVS